ncbi:TIGR00645 family protein [Gynuella sunshinyii]|uniref:UPF0114 protein YC6258_03113 n=1 Tax=Gynuella sunshinyii YC6258 TaxID=1445510 RepID=A0A0C5VXK6_9GAMM|nr:TIGR00645 family protein [Gynuella sunshinyii]AJQ95149.1 putative membrane protein [Gynuella sunshinyii YC6258]
MLEKLFENLLYSARWLLAPVYLGLSVMIAAVTIKFFQELFHILPVLFSAGEVDIILKALSLIDLALVGGLLVMVMFSGYENFVSQLDIAEDKEKLGWLGKLDVGTLKNKVATSIVAISSIHLLKVFMELESLQDNDRIMWYVLIHLTFVISAFMMGLLDRVNRKESK